MKNLYQKIVDTIPVFFFLWSRDQKETIFISEKFYDHKSNNYYAPERSREDLRQYIHQESRQSYDQFFANLSEENHFHDEIELRAADSLPEIKWMKLSTFPVIDEGKDIEYIAGHISNITHSKEYSEFLENQVESLDTVAFMLAHEMSAPITNMMGLAELLKHKVEETGDTRFLHLYDAIYNFGGEVLTVAHGLVSLLELQAEKNQLPRKATQLKPFVEKLIQNFYFKPTQRVVQILSDELENTSVYINPTKFTQAIEELLVFLLKYIKGDGRITISTPKASDPKNIELWIVTKGVLLPKQPIRRIMDQSARLNMLDVKGGGVRGLLELVIAKEILELHQGGLRLIDEPERQGFILHFPLHN